MLIALVLIPNCLYPFMSVCLQVSAWGGYVFIINLIPLHVFALIAMGRYSQRIYVGMATLGIFLN